VALVGQAHVDGLGRGGQVGQGNDAARAVQGAGAGVAAETAAARASRRSQYHEK